MTPRYVAHLSDDRDRRRTACGEPWQGWQAPRGATDVVPPSAKPVPHVTVLYQCQLCFRLGQLR